ncbi:hypothetical protein Syun_006073 [Stephania yunnanensis]|uniref:R3H domain-containing protein n=1 Tax=Stephania yunnanensis TaxID=152371 RepID=A0AAP0KVY1_9MAGN
MSTTQFAMVEELSSLIKDNLTSKHIVLSVEEILVDFLKNDTSTDGLLELEPMSPYNRLLLHRLAEIFGFLHESVGEGDDRHLILERCSESSIPSILVSDLLYEYDEYQSPTSPHQLLRRKDTSPALKTDPSSLRSSLEERQAAYLAARERIFSVDDNKVKESVTPKPRNVPVVARRMIAHALGQRMSNSSIENVQVPGFEEHGRNMKELSIKETNGSHPDQQSSISPEPQSQKVRSFEKTGHANPQSGNFSGRRLQEQKVNRKPANNKSVSVDAQLTGSTARSVSDESLKKEHLGAAKRIFANALRLQGTKDISEAKIKG